MDFLFRQYAQLTVFLGSIIGPDYEIILYDLSDLEHSVVAISNSGISGIKLGDPIDENNRRLLETADYQKNPYQLNYGSIVGNNRVLRCSSLFITDEKGQLRAMLCINFDDSNYRELNEKLLKLCHPDIFLNTSVQLLPGFGNLLPYPEEKYEVIESPQQNAEDLLMRVIRSVEEETGIAKIRFLHTEKMLVIKKLHEKCFFDVKGSIKFAAKELNSSQASIYRYLSEVRNMAEREES